MSATEDLQPPPPSYQNFTDNLFIDRISIISEQLPTYLELTQLPTRQAAVIPPPTQQSAVRGVERNQSSSIKKQILPLFKRRNLPFEGRKKTAIKKFFAGVLVLPCLILCVVPPLALIGLLIYTICWYKW